MAPPAPPQTSGAAALQDAIDVKINQAVFGFALAAAGLIVLGTVAYVCFLAVGRHCRRRVDVEEPVRQPPRPLVLPRKLEEAGGAPRRMILSPLFQLPVYDLEEPGQGAFSEHVGHSWRASLHAMGIAGASGHSHGSDPDKEDEDDCVPLAERQAALRASARSMTPPLSPSGDLSSSPDTTLESAVVETPVLSNVLPASAHTPPPATVVEVIQSRGSSPDIVVEDYAPHLSSSILSSSSSLSSAETVDNQFLCVPPMSWNAPREYVSFVSDPETLQVKSLPKQIKKKSSMSKLVSALGEISNVIRLRPELPSPTANPKKVQRSVKRGKENVVVCSA